jgi:hypothetical protein
MKNFIRNIFKNYSEHIIEFTFFQMISFMQRIDKTALLVVLPPDINFTDQVIRNQTTFGIFHCINLDSLKVFHINFVMC